MSRRIRRCQSKEEKEEEEEEEEEERKASLARNDCLVCRVYIIIFSALSIETRE